MTQQDIAEAKQLLSGIQEKDLPAELKEASIKQIALAQQAAAHYIGTHKVNHVNEPFLYRYELIVKEMCDRGFIQFAGCFDESNEVLEGVMADLKAYIIAQVGE